MIFFCVTQKCEDIKKLIKRSITNDPFIRLLMDIFVCRLCYSLYIYVEE